MPVQKQAFRPGLFRKKALQRQIKLLIKTFKGMKNFWFTAHSYKSGWAKKLILTMKLTIFILFLSLMQVSASVYSQATKFTFKYENKEIAEVLREIEDNSKFRFFYLREQVDVERLLPFQQKKPLLNRFWTNYLRDRISVMS